MVKIGQNMGKVQKTYPNWSSELSQKTKTLFHNLLNKDIFLKMLIVCKLYIKIAKYLLKKSILKYSPVN